MPFSPLCDERLCIQHIFVAKIEFEKKENEKNTLEKYIGKIFKISSRQREEL